MRIPATPSPRRNSTRVKPGIPRNLRELVDVILQTIAGHECGERTIAINSSSCPGQRNGHLYHFVAVSGGHGNGGSRHRPRESWPRSTISGEGVILLGEAG